MAKQWVSKANPWEPLDYDDDVTYAVRAWHAAFIEPGAKGMSVAQQKLLWAWLVEYGCGRDDIPFRPDDKGGDRATNFACGKMYIGQQIRKHLHPAMTPPALNAKPEPAKTKKPRKRKAQP